jgi:hypothetical protein
MMRLRIAVVDFCSHPPPDQRVCAKAALNYLTSLTWCTLSSRTSPGRDTAICSLKVILNFDGQTLDLM